MTRETTLKLYSVVLPVLTCLACGGASEAEKPPVSAVACPEGQVFDGSYCVLDSSAGEGSATPPKNEQPSSSGSGGSSPSATPEAQPAPTASGGAASGSAAATTGGAATGGAATGGSPSTSPSAAEVKRAVGVDMTMAAALGPVIHYLSASHLPAGAKMLGVPFAGQFGEGEILEQRVTLVAGKCYTVVAAALPPVADVSIELFALAEGKPPRSIGRDTEVGTQAVLGRKEGCFRPQAGETSALLVLKVEKGRGVAAAQVFEK